MDWAAGPLKCCCVGPGNRAQFTGDLPVSSSYGPSPAPPTLQGSAPGVAEPLPPQSTRPGALVEGSGAAQCVGAGGNDAGASARSTVSGESVMSLEEREHEKARLQKLVKAFARESVIGLPVTVISPETARITSYCLQMNRNLTAFSLRPTDGTTPHAGSAQALHVKDLVWIGRGLEVAAKAPQLGGVAAACVGLGTKRGEQQIVLHFDESLERDRFYTCMRVLRMSADVPGA